jgi:tetratricopeptide (TPR) repeat protein
MRWWRRRRDEEGRLASDLLSDLQYGHAHLARAQRTADYEDADAAVRLLRSVVSNPKADGAFLTGYRTTLAEALLLRASLVSSKPDLDEAAELLALAAAGPHLDSEAEVRTLCAVAELHDALATANSNPAEVDVAIEVARRAVTALSPAHPATLSRLAAALERRAVMSGDRADFGEAVATYRLALKRAESEEPSIRVGVAMSLAAALGMRYERYGELADLDESIGLAADASAAAETEADRASALRTLASSSAARYEVTKRADDLRNAVRSYRDLLLSGGRSRRDIAVDAVGWANLAGVIGGHYDRNDAITSAEAAVEVPAPGDPDRDRRVVERTATFVNQASTPVDKHILLSDTTQQARMGEVDLMQLFRIANDMFHAPISELGEHGGNQHFTELITRGYRYGALGERAAEIGVEAALGERYGPYQAPV